MILLTGYGSIGSLIAKRILLKDPLTPLLIIDRHEEAIHRAMMELSGNVIAVVADVSNQLDMERIFNYDIRCVVNTAAMKHVTFCETNPTLAVINNVIGMNYLLEQSVRSRIKKFINISTDKAALPANVMGATKFIAERLIIAYSQLDPSIKFQSLRLGNVLCSASSLVPTIVSAVKKKLPLKITNLDATRFFITPEDAGDFISRALNGYYDGQILIKKLKAANLRTMVNAILEIVGDKDYHYDVVGLRQGEKMHEHLYSETENTHMIDHGKYWAINFSESHPELPVIDSSQFCISYQEFLTILKDVM